MRAISSLLKPLKYYSRLMAHRCLVQQRWLSITRLFNNQGIVIMNNIYALQGRGNVGKSSTLKIVYDEIAHKYPSATIQNLTPKTADIKMIISNVNGHVIGIESQGDPNSRLERSLQDFEQAGCNIIFCATRSFGMTVNWVNSLSPRYAVHFIQQAYVTPNSQQASNLQMALQLIAQAGL